jgi:hypothetical protein
MNRLYYFYNFSFRRVFQTRSKNCLNLLVSFHTTEHVPLKVVVNKHVQEKKTDEISAKEASAVNEEEDEMEEMFIQGPAGLEWGGPTRGGRRPEPTRYGDWERKGRVSDFQ